MTPQAADPCGRDVVAIYDLKRRNESNANYDLIGRYYYLWPDNAACREEVHDRLAGVARITQEVRPNGLLCEVQLHLDFDVAEDEKYGPNRFSKLITLVGADTSRFAATAPGETGATVFYEAPAHTVDRAAGPADENSDVVTDRTEAPPRRRQSLHARAPPVLRPAARPLLLLRPVARGLLLGERRASRLRRHRSAKVRKAWVGDTNDAMGCAPHAIGRRAGVWDDTTASRTRNEPFRSGRLARAHGRALVRERRGHGRERRRRPGGDRGREGHRPRHRQRRRPLCRRTARPGRRGACTCPGFEKFGACKHQAAVVTAANAADLSKVRERMSRLRDGLALDSREALIERLVELARVQPTVLAALEDR